MPWGTTYNQCEEYFETRRSILKKLGTIIRGRKYTDTDVFAASGLIHEFYNGQDIFLPSDKIFIHTVIKRLEKIHDNRGRDIDMSELEKLISKMWLQYSRQTKERDDNE